MEEGKKTCAFFIKEKKRYCKFDKYKNSEYCSHHYENTELFVPCPIDPNHTVLASKLQKHLPVCPKAKERKLLSESVWYKESINIPSGCTLCQDEENADETGKGSKSFLKEMLQNNVKDYLRTLEVIPSALEKALELYKADLLKGNKLSDLNIDDITTVDYVVDLKNYEINTNTEISDRAKDVKQCQELVSMLKKFDLLSEDFTYVEYGAGKGGLSHHISTENKDKSQHLLIELEGRRHKQDKNHREGQTFVRLKANIKDFDLSALPVMMRNPPKPEERADRKTEQKNEQKTEEKSEEKPEETKDSSSTLNKKTKAVGITKHMCGLASDMTIYSLVNASAPELEVEGFMISTCCHHRCDSGMYVDIEFLEKIGIDKDLQRTFFHVTSWGIYHENLLKQIPKKKEKDENEPETNRKTELGRQAKRIIDIGRALYLRRKGFDCFMLKYCDGIYSPENFVLIGKRKSEEKKEV